MRILITNQKGGVGKSTIAVNLAYFFAAWRRKSVSLIDFDRQASASHWVKTLESARTRSTHLIHAEHACLPSHEGYGRVIIECRRVLQRAEDSHDIVIADLTWQDAFDGEFFREFDLVVLPTALSEVELVTTIEFVQRFVWAFQTRGRNPSLVIAPSRVRLDQAAQLQKSSTRFPFSFIMTPPVLDSIDAKKSFAKHYLLSHTNLKLSDSFARFCRGIEQAMEIHHERHPPGEKSVIERMRFSSLKNPLQAKAELSRAGAASEDDRKVIHL